MSVCTSHHDQSSLSEGGGLLNESVVKVWLLYVRESGKF